MAAPQPFYLVRSRSLRDSLDPRAKRERLLLEMANCIRDDPTIPADPHDANKAWTAALAEDMAVELPRVHCSFRGCTWCGKTEEERGTHIVMTHKEELLPIADTLPKCFSERTRIESVYNEAIATKTRQGAPVACFAIQRRAVNGYMDTICNSEIQFPICFVCACKFPYVSAREVNDIKWVKPFTAVSDEDKRIKHFLQKEHHDVEHMFGLQT